MFDFREMQIQDFDGEGQLWTPKLADIGQQTNIS